MPETTEPLTEAQVDEIEARHARCMDNKNQSRLAEASILIASDLPRLIRDWRAMRTAQADHSDECRIFSQAVREAEGNRDRAVKLVEVLRQRLEVKSELLDKAMAQALELDTQNTALREQLAGYKSCVTCHCGRPTWHRKEDNPL